MSGATDLVVAQYGPTSHYDTSGGVYVSPGDAITLLTNSTWCVLAGSTQCTNAAGASTQYRGVSDRRTGDDEKFH